MLSPVEEQILSLWYLCSDSIGTPPGSSFEMSCSQSQSLLSDLKSADGLEEGLIT